MPCLNGRGKILTLFFLFAFRYVKTFHNTPRDIDMKLLFFGMLVDSSNWMTYHFACHKEQLLFQHTKRTQAHILSVKYEIPNGIG